MHGWFNSIVSMKMMLWFDTIHRVYQQRCSYLWLFQSIANPIPPPVEEAIHNNNETFVMANKLNWTQIFEDTNYSDIPDMTPMWQHWNRIKVCQSIWSNTIIILWKGGLCSMLLGVYGWMISWTWLLGMYGRSISIWMVGTVQTNCTGAPIKKS